MTKAQSRALIGAALFLLPLLVFGGNETLVRAGVMPKAPQIDGVIHEEEWRGAVPFFGFKRHNSEVLAHRQGVWRIGFTAKNLFFSCRSQLPPKGMRLNSKIAQNGKKIYRDDTVELLFFTPKNDYVFQLGANPKGKYFSTCYKIADGAVTHTKMLDWDPQVRVASKMHDGVWDIEVAVPLAQLGFSNGKASVGKWGFQLARTYYKPFEVTGLTKSQLFCYPQHMAEFIFDPGVPSGGLATLGKDYAKCRYDIELPVFNNTSTARKVECAVNITSGAAPRFLNKTVEIPPRGSHVFRLKYDEPAASVDAYDLKAQITDCSSGKTLFRRSFSWTPPPASLWKEKKASSVEFEFAHYPSYGKMKARYGNPQIKAAPDVTGVKFSIRNGRGEIVSSSAAEKKPYGFFAIWEIGRLPDGKYTIEAEMTHKDGKKTVKSAAFESAHFPWENNKIGMDRVIIPPFTPLRVEGREIHALQTGYRLKNGFFDAVYAQGRNILAGPADLVIDGKKDCFKERSFRFTEKSPDRVVAETLLEGKSVSVKAVSEFDYDGMCKMTLHFIPQGKWETESMILEIPLRAEEASQMHGMQGIPHFHPARFLKAGEGRIWNNLDERQNPRLKTPFWPYMWFGGQYRGIAWFAPSDKNWNLKKDAVSTELVRENGAVTLKVHLFNQKTVREKPFEIVMGFMASPVKPRPENWRQYTSRWKPAPHARFMASLSGSYIWGTWRPSDPFPVNNDYEMARKLGRDTRRKSAVERKDIGEFIKRNCGHMQLDEIRRLRLHLERGRDFARNGDILHPYMNPASGSDAWPDFRTFQDEWHHAEYRNMVDYDEYSMYSSPSHRDFLIYYVKKLLDCGLDGIYWDNCGGGMLVFDPVTGPAYELPDGSIQPYCDWFGRRELIKRTAVAAYLAGKTVFDNRPMVDLHITNGITLPYLSFAAFQLDLERGYGPTEFHERFSEEHILTETLGTHTGCAPAVLCGLTGNDLEHITRSFMCYTFAYDLPNVVWAAHHGKIYSTLWRKLFQFGYGTKDVEVVTFWDEGAPKIVTAKDRDARITVYRRKDRAHAVVAVCDMGNQKRRTAVDVSGLKYKNITASDFETGRKLAVSPDGIVEVDLPRREFVLLELRGE